VSSDAKKKSGRKATHAGGVVYRRRDGRTEYLVIQASDRADTWVLPKGRREKGESLVETAVREIAEESGVLARSLGEVVRSTYRRRLKRITVDYFLMEYAGETEPEEDRIVLWCRLKEARRRLTHRSSRDVLDWADARRRARDS
jgi:8-oxo-dGTP pyrophosphatase MutT (NUDIX family)